MSKPIKSFWKCLRRNPAYWLKLLFKTAKPLLPNNSWPKSIPKPLPLPQRLPHNKLRLPHLPPKQPQAQIHKPALPCPLLRNWLQKPAWTLLPFKVLAATAAY